jgi:hypothetical protein
MQINFLSEIGKVGPVETRPAVIREALGWELAHAQAWINEMPERIPDDAAWGAYFAREHIENIPQLLAAAESGDLWAAVGYALRIGYNDGRWHMYPQRVKETRKAKAMAPLAGKWMEAQGHRSEGGRTRAAKYAEARSRSAALLRAMGTQDTRPKWTRACGKVAAAVGVSLSAVHTWHTGTDVDWRTRK